MDLILDHIWVRIDSETKTADDEPPKYARNVRTLGGSIIGRVVRYNGGSKYCLERFSGGAFKDIGTFDTVDFAFRAITEAAAKGVV